VRQSSHRISIFRRGVVTVKLLLAIIRPTKLRAVQDALKSVGVERMTVCDAHGYGRQRGQTETYRGVEYKVNLLRKVVLEIVVNDDFVDRTVETIEMVARTGNEGNIGDGKIFQVPVEQTIRIGQTVSGKEAV
jgi:nitrogen regulatory protein P-II 1